MTCRFKSPSMKRDSWNWCSMGYALPATVVGRDTGSTQMTEMALVTTTTPDSVLQVINPPGAATTLTISPYAGSGGLVTPVSASLIIERLS